MNKKQNFTDLLNQLTPFEFSLLATITGYVLASNLNYNEQNALGNWFELVGQILLTISAQGTTSLTDKQYQNIINDIEMLKKEILNR